MLTFWEKFVFGIVILATASAFLHPLIRRYRIVRAGRSDPRLDEVWRRVRETLAKILPQRCTLKNERLFTGFMHVFISRKADELEPLVPGAVTEGEIWTCTTCGACMHVCPVEIEHVPKIVGMRRSQVLMESKFPPELNRSFSRACSRKGRSSSGPGKACRSPFMILATSAGTTGSSISRGTS